MIDRRVKNREIFEDTMAFIGESKTLQAALANSVAKQQLFLETEDVPIDCVSLPDGVCQTIVSRKRSFEAAATYAKAGKKVCVLNFASATNPGGGVVNGSSAQEEALCRCSTLYSCLNLESLWKSFYYPHRQLDNPLYNDDCLFTPDVMVIKSDVSFPERMPEDDWYQVDVITCAAPNLRNVPSNAMNPHAGSTKAEIESSDLYKLHVKRIDRIFRVAVANGAQVLILGAFGCGAFMNPPEIVAKAFRDVQNKYEKYFDTIEYAVFCGGHETQNYDAFCSEFSADREYDLSRFVDAHERDYEIALKEIKNGRKISHWMWYIFPQIKGLGYSSTSKFYAISDIEEAKAYLRHPVLGEHLREICKALLNLDTNDASYVFGYPDDMKLKSSMTLFCKADPNCQLFCDVIDKFFASELDSKTCEILNKIDE